MDKATEEQIKRAGWETGTVQELLGLTDEEAAMLEIQLALAQELKRLRGRLGLTQQQAAEQLGSSQTRVARMEAPAPDVSIDLLMRSLLKLGMSTKDIAETLAMAA